MNAQLVDTEELREDLKAAIVDEVLEGGVNQNESNQSAAAATNPDGLTLTLDQLTTFP